MPWSPWSPVPLQGTFIGAVTLTGSAVAFGKLHGLLNSKPLNIWGALRDHN